MGRNLSITLPAWLLLLCSFCWLSAIAAAAPPQGFVAIFNGKDLDGWVVRQPDNHDWQVVEGVIDCDPHGEGKGDQNLWTKQEYADFELLVDWRIKESPFVNRNARIIQPDGTYQEDKAGNEIAITVPNADSGIFLRGQHKSQVNIWCWPVGSSEVWGYRTDPKCTPEVHAGVTPKVNADRPIGQWNTFAITMQGDRLRVELNGTLVIENARLAGIPPKGPIALQHHGDRKDGDWGASLLQFRNVYIKELTHAAAPYPPSPVIRSIEWAPPGSIVRQAQGGDNWPITWADDDYLYTAYGDGNGFRPKLKEKLSLGLARVEGLADAFQGVNLRSADVEQKGDGPKGKKASGLLMVDGVLYLLVRNAQNAQLARSADHGQTWQWADWRFGTSFGCPSFLNFGRNYAGARDDYVYIYSHESDSAYTPADRMVLARVSKSRIMEQHAYKFFARCDAAGEPVWAQDIAQRGAVFEHPGNCYRSGISYNAPLKRYLWWQVIPGGDTRFSGGLGIYDALQPWGPWTTVYFNTQWDVGPGESGSFPSKWMSDDGRTIHLVFSGDDCFSVRKGLLPCF